MSKRTSNPGATLDETLHTLKLNLPELRQSYGVKSLGVFGSYARRENRPRSDLDLLVEFHRAPTFFEFVRLERCLTTMLGVKVDLVMKTALKPEIGKRILAEVMQV
ncbi:MAG: DNA polymerase III subunit beta [Dehalococcoidia bacterium]|nr:DNA polymerase III subunit beta [Dehalococcoidia bacterium]MSQ16087.1 DNA polymerase III subunit beta [Dehalococcoidia bacterium]